MRIFSLIQIAKTLRLLIKLPVLFSLDTYGVTDRNNITTPWTEIQKVYYVNRAWKLYLQVRPNSQYKNIVFKEEEIGFSSMDIVKSFIKEHAPDECTFDF